MENIFDLFARTLENENMIRIGDKVLLAVSGGPDSMALLYLFYWWGQCELGIFHLNHGFRLNAINDASLVSRVAEQLKIHYHPYSFNVPDYLAKTGESKQQGAREIRYKLMEKCVREYGYSKVATGHHADDQAETVLMRLLRGSGLKGLRGILPVRDNFIRPLLQVDKESLINYCDQNNIPYCQDESNLQSIYERNKVRLELLPLLEKEYSSQIRTILGRIAESARADDEQLELIVENYFNKYVECNKGSVSVLKDTFSNLSVSLQRRLLRKCVEQIKGDTKRIEFKHIEDLRTYIANQRPFRLDLPSVVVKGTKGKIMVYKIDDNSKVPGNKWNLCDIQIPGITKVNNHTIEVRLYDRSDAPQRQRNEEDFAYDSLKLPLICRPRNPGDKMQVFGSPRQKKIKELFIDAKIPYEERDNIPIICDQENIIYIPRVRRSEKGRITETTTKILRIRVW